MIANLKA